MELPKAAVDAATEADALHNAPTLSLSAEAIAELTPIATELNTIPYYKASALRKVLDAVPQSILHDASTWLQAMRSAIDGASRLRIEQLINQIIARHGDDVQATGR